MAAGAYIVADFGKTHSKVSLWSKDGQMLDRLTRANISQSTAHYPALDIHNIGDWLIDALKGFSGHPVEAIIPVAHGAAAVGLLEGELAFPPLDYEHPIPETELTAYRKLRDSFAFTGSPALPGGLNLGSQLHWLETLHGNKFAQSTLLPYPQYWAWFLSGNMRSEVTSLGCHTDLWSPDAGGFSSMATARGWAAQFAPLAKAGESIGSLRKELAAEAGLSENVTIHAGLHDSNAALLAARGFAEIADNDATILSTGTWFVAMRSSAPECMLDQLAETRDCLVNVDAFGTAIPSSRFMGGREIELLIKAEADRIDDAANQQSILAALPDILQSGAMVLPSFASGCGPYPHRKGRWINQPEGKAARSAAIGLYAALVAQTSLSLIGAKSILLIEGRFAKAEIFVRALASLLPELAVYTADAENDVSFGALRLLDARLKPEGRITRAAPLDINISAYAQSWRNQVNEQT